MPRLPLLCVLSVLLLGLLSPVDGRSEVIDRVVAVVNSEAITQSELDERWEQMRQIPGAPSSREALLARMIELRLQQQRAKALRMSADATDVENALNGILEDNNIPSLTALENVLKAEGRSLAEFRKEIATQISLMRVIQAEVTSQVRLGEAELRAYYDAHPDEFREKGTVRLRQIHLAIDDTAEDATGAVTMAELRKKVVDRKTFMAAEAGLANQPGITVGAAGEFSPDELLPELAEALDQLPEGAVTKPVSLPNGTAIFLVDAITGTEPMPFERIIPLVRERATAAATERQLAKWLSQLKADAYIEIRTL